MQEGGGREEGLRTRLSDWPPTAAAQTGEGIKKGTAELTSAAAAAAANVSLNSTEDHSRSPVAVTAAAEQVSAQIASQTLWESKVLESIMPSGFYSMVPVSFWIIVHQHACLIRIHLCVCVCVCMCVSLDSSSLSLTLSQKVIMMGLVIQSISFKASCPTIPTLEELEQLGAEAAGSDVLLVDTHKDTTLANLEEFAKVLVNGLRGNVALAIKKIAELVRDLWHR